MDGQCYLPALACLMGYILGLLAFEANMQMED